MQVVPGETALAFYRAKNPTDKPITGISTYNVVPFEAGQYFNKIQVNHKSSNAALFTSCVSSVNNCFFFLSAVFLLRGAASEPSRGGGHARLLLHWPRVWRGPQDGSSGHHYSVLHLLWGQGWSEPTSTRIQLQLIHPLLTQWEDTDQEPDSGSCFSPRRPDKSSSTLFFESERCTLTQKRRFLQTNGKLCSFRVFGATAMNEQDKYSKLLITK